MDQLTTRFDREASLFREWAPHDQRKGYVAPKDPFEACRPVGSKFKFNITPAAGQNALNVAFAIERLVPLAQAEVTKPRLANNFNPACITLSGKGNSNTAWDILSKRPDLIANINGFVVQATRPETTPRTESAAATL